MLFNSLHFLLFFPFTLLIFFLLSPKHRWLFLLLASCYFYMAYRPAFILILLGIIAIDYIGGLLIERSSGVAKKLYLGLSLASNLGLLFFFKYANFALENFARLAGVIGAPSHFSPLDIVLPVGLSFHTFQALSYTIEVYRGNQKAERHLGIYALYVLYWPQLVAGPIERPQNILHQLHSPRSFTWDSFRVGSHLVLWGFFKKLVIADRLGIFVKNVYDAPESAPGFACLLATYFFAIQIYCDFSGYSDIARGSAAMMGVDLMRNFRTPYLSPSLPEFWRRWHISLSSWFRDYVYVPLGGKQSRFWATFATFFLSGLWHGASWTFVAWGLFHGTLVYLFGLSAGIRRTISQSLGLDRIPKVSRAISIFVTFNVVCFGWVLFRAVDLQNAFTIWTRMVTFNAWNAASVVQSYDARLFGLQGPELVLVLLCIALMLLVEALHPMRWRGSTALRLPRPIHAAAFYCFAILVIILGKYTNQQFIYFQF